MLIKSRLNNVVCLPILSKSYFTLALSIYYIQNINWNTNVYAPNYIRVFPRSSYVLVFLRQIVRKNRATKLYEFPMSSKHFVGMLA